MTGSDRCPAYPCATNQEPFCGDCDGCEQAPITVREVAALRAERDEAVGAALYVEALFQSGHSKWSNQVLGELALKYPDEFEAAMKLLRRDEEADDVG